MMATSFCRGFSTIHIKGTGKALSLPEVWNSRCGLNDERMNWRSECCYTDAESWSQTERWRRNCDRSSWFQRGRWVCSHEISRAEAKSDGRQWKRSLSTASDHWIKPVNDLMLDNMSSLTRRRQICSIVIIKYTERSTFTLDCVIIIMIS